MTVLRGDGATVRWCDGVDSPTSTFRLTTKADQMNSIMAGSDDISADAFGITIGVWHA